MQGFKASYRFVILMIKEINVFYKIQQDFNAKILYFKIVFYYA